MIMKKEEGFDFERFKQEAMDGLYAGKKFGGTDGVVAPLLKYIRVDVGWRVGGPFGIR